MIVRPEDFGAVGDGIANDTTPLQNWLNALGPGVTGALPNKTYLFTNTLTLPARDNCSIFGENPYSSKLLYGGSSTTIDLIVLGNDSRETLGWVLRDFAIDSNTRMTAGSALRLVKCIFCSYDGVTICGQYSGSQFNVDHKLWDGMFFDGFYYSTLERSDVKVRNEGIKLRGRNVQGAGSYAAGLIITGGKIGGCTTGIHAGGDGCCFVIDDIDIIGNVQDGVLIDTAYGTIGNNQIFFGSGVTLDTNGRDGLRVNDALGGFQFLQLDGTWSASNSGSGINILNWGTNGTVKLADVMLTNNTSAGFRISTNVPRVVITGGISDVNGSYGLFRSGAAPGRPNNVSVRDMLIRGNPTPFIGSFDGLSENYSPTVSSQIGSFGTTPTVNYAKYTLSGNVGVSRLVNYRVQVQFGNIGTANGAVVIPLPYVPAAGQRFYLSGLNRTNNAILIGITDGSPNLYVYTQTFGFAAGTNHLIELSGTYETD